ncbi:hypothetical protein [Micropruina sonneratiae]|uniref:hypothetical protein n=1 Tax=Micropruina sonneratiae TaxID=2986940 RepID=UPI0022279EF7|nr:hypothetical protein [Micropruina sp. KQZ13P-5]MCW3159369.1 hypothetical protein [Micropruina sp. KQZ13P-5]
MSLPLTRRSALGGVAALGLTIPVQLAATAPAQAAQPQSRRGQTSAALGFLQRAVDAYRSSGPRLVQSYQDDSGLTDIAFVYDNALAIIALLAAGDRRRARELGDGLLYAMGNDETFTDFRLRQAYHANTFTNPDGTAHFGWEFGLTGTAVGDMSWAGIALAQLTNVTGNARYGEGALRIGRWIQRNARSTSGLKGYTFGETAGLEDHKSSEHNIDVYAFFTLLYRLTREAAWQNRAAHAWAFVERVWNADDGFFWTGSDDGSTINKAAAQLPLDVQTWSWLAARKSRYARALDWARTNLASTDTPLRANSALTGNYSQSGVVFASGSLLADPTTNIGGQEWNPKPDVAAVWLEGTAQLALALSVRNAAGDADRSASLLASLAAAQDNLGRGQKFGGTENPGGLVAASSPLDTGFGFGYFPNLHVGATSWYLMALLKTNPYRFV